MHPNRKFQLADREEMAAIARDVGFGALVVQTPEGLRAVHVPFLLEEDRFRFHVSRGNAVHGALSQGCEALLLVEGPHAYISPDWYGLEDRVPTWNYVALEITGPVVPLDSTALAALVDGLSDAHEARLLPKPPWSKDKMSAGRYEGLLKAIAGFELRAMGWRGTAKVDQDKPAEVRERIAAALDARGEAAMAALMRRERPWGA
jgi:transcriptional regulator